MLYGVPASGFRIARRRPPVRVLLLLLPLILAGCATQPERLPGNTLPLEGLTHWRLDGKLGFRSPEKNGSAWIDWVQQGDAYRLQLNGPFGAASTRIRGDDSFAVLSQSGREDVTAPSGEALSARLFGWPFPVSELAHWVKGEVAPGSPADATRNRAGLLRELKQQGWQLTFDDYSTAVGWTLPGRIRGQRGELGFTLVIKGWQPDPGRE